MGLILGLNILAIIKSFSRPIFKRLAGHSVRNVGNLVLKREQYRQAMELSTENDAVEK